MITVQLSGGLGNQMFQYALGRRLSIEHSAPLLLDLSKLKHDKQRTYRLHVYHLETHKIIEKNSIVTKTINRLFPKKNCTYKEPHFHFDENVFKQKTGTFDGYWQSERYFQEIRQVLLEDFTLKAPLRPRVQQWDDLITNCESVAIHIRRGDYTVLKNKAIHGLVSITWYMRSLQYMQAHLKQPIFFFFSDDMNWVQENFPSLPDSFYFDASRRGFEQEELYLMSRCKHQIIANSTFGWWASWLNRHEKKMVIAPNKWFADSHLNTQDLIPASWIKV